MDPYDADQDSASVYGQNLARRDVPMEHPCQELQKLLSNGSFYYSTDFDVTNRLQDRCVCEELGSGEPLYPNPSHVNAGATGPRTQPLSTLTTSTNRSCGILT